MKDLYSKFRSIHGPEESLEFLASLSEDEFRSLKKEFTIYGKSVLTKNREKALEKKAKAIKYDEYIEDLRKQLINGEHNDGYLIRLQYERFNIEEYKQYKEKFTIINNAAIKGELSSKQLLEAVELGIDFFVEVLSSLNNNQTEEFGNVVEDAMNTFGFPFDDHGA